jgi:hypothetical protein
MLAQGSGSHPAIAQILVRVVSSIVFGASPLHFESSAEASTIIARNRTPVLRGAVDPLRLLPFGHRQRPHEHFRWASHSHPSQFRHHVRH